MTQLRRVLIVEVARELGISKNTVKNHVSKMLRKMKVISTSAAIAEGFRRGILE